MVVPNIQQTINESTFSLPIAVSLVLHIGIIYFITHNVDWSSKQKDILANPVQAFVLNDYKAKQQPVKQKTPAELEAEAIKLRDAAVERIHQERLMAEEKEKRAKAEKEKLEKARLAKQKAEEERLLQEALAAEEAELEKMRQEELANELTAEQSRLGQLHAEYKYAIRDKISRNWNKPITMQDSYQCSVLVKQIPGGEIVNVEIKSCNGNAVFKQSVENALNKVKTLPYSGYQEVFSRDIEFIFKPE